MRVVDVGANEGLYTLFAAARVGPRGGVWAFEPSRRDFSRLTENVRLNRLENVQAFPVALGRASGRAELRIAADEHAGQNTLGRFAYPIEQLRTETVPVGRLDDLLSRSGLGRVDVLKIDAEGAEVAILDGARDTIATARPLMILEVSEKSLQHQDSSSACLVEWLRSHGYLVAAFSAATGAPELRSSGELGDNIVAVPAGTPLADRLHAAAGRSFQPRKVSA